jgi:hypothetical protein
MNAPIMQRAAQPPRIAVPTTDRQFGIAFDLASALNVPLDALLLELMRRKIVLCVDEQS